MNVFPPMAGAVGPQLRHYRPPLVEFKDSACGAVRNPLSSPLSHGNSGSDDLGPAFC